MDITITDTDGTPSDHDLAHYLAPRSSSSTNPLSWREADTSFQFGQLFNAPSSFETLTLPWSGEATGNYPVPDHPIVDRHGGGLNLALSNQSYSTGTLSDSGSRHSSNSYASASATIVNNAELGFVGASEAQWQNVSAVYGIHDHETHLPPLRLPDHDRSSLYIPAPHPSTHYLPPSSLLPPQMPYDTPASAFSSHSHFHTPSQYHALPPTFLPSRESFSDHNFLAPSGLSTPSIHSSPEERPRYISMDQLTGPYTIDPTNSMGMASATGSSFVRRGRGRGAGRGSASSTRGGPGGGRGRGRGAGRGGRRMAPAARPDSPVVPAPSPVASSSRIKRRRPSYTSSSSSTHNTSSSGASGQVNVDSLDLSMKRTRHANNGRGTAEASSTKMPTSSDDEAEYGDDGDDDIYMPSRSASEEPGSDSGHSDPSTSKNLLKRKGKDKMPVMSAAEALAQTAARYPNNNYADNAMVADGVVDQTEVGSSGEWRPLPLRASGATSGTSSPSASKGRRNGTISLPVPVPHLTKKSRGRKVPYVDARAARGGSRFMDEEDDSDSGEGVARGASSGRRGRAGRGGGFGTRGRSFVCQVAGCGKCFVRGEHLKRHVRSIHTNEKPYPCPYEGCNKSFSRRDNLGQHVRLHLMGSG